MKEIPHTSQARRPDRLHLLAVATFLVAAGLAVVIFYTNHPKPPVLQKAPSPTAGATQSSTVADLDVEPGVSVPAAPGEKTTVAVKAPAEPVQSIEELVKILRDTAQPIKARIKAARALLANGSAEAMAAIKETLREGPAPLRAAIAEGLGSCSSPESYSLMYGLLSDSNETVAMGAVRGLAQQGSAQAANALSRTFFDATVPLNVRCEAALNLGTVNQPGIVDTLIHGVATINDEAVVTQLLNALGGRPIDETKGFFENYLKSPTVSSELKTTAIEALANAQGDVTSLLLSYAGNSDAELRASAAWALSTTDTPGAVQDKILSWLQSESDPAVRLRLFQALANQETFNVPMVQQLIQNEPNLSARTAGFDLIAGQLRENPSPELAAYFDGTAVPQLKTTAMTATGSSDRMSAVIALKRAGTAGALAALQQVAQQSTDPRVRKSASGS